MKKSAFFSKNGGGCRDLNAVFPHRLKANIAAQTQLFPEVITPENFPVHSAGLRDLEVIFATWGMWEFTPDQMAAMPNLQAVFYGAGSVRHFAEPLLQRDILLTSAWAFNAVPVAEWTLAQILLANKGYWRNQREYRERDQYDVFHGRGNYGATVSILGAGQIGRRVIEFLRPFSLRVLCYDPYLSHKAAEILGVEKVELEEAFGRGDVVSNHVADLSATIGIINGPLLHLMPQSATFINTGRGATVENNDDLISVMTQRADLTALLDVTEPEPLPLSHPLRTLPNIYLTSHIAGSIGDEVARMGQAAFDEFLEWRAGKPARYPISFEMLETMA